MISNLNPDSLNQDLRSSNMKRNKWSENKQNRNPETWRVKWRLKMVDVTGFAAWIQENITMSDPDDPEVDTSGEFEIKI